MELEHESKVAVAEFAELFAGEARGGMSVNGQAARVGEVQRPQDLKQGGFARAGGAYNGHHFARFDVEVDATKDFQFAIAFDDVLGLNHG